MTSTPLGAGGYHWQSADHVARWDQIQSGLEADREAGFRAMVDLLPPDRSAPLRIVDLGAGDGKVAATVLDHYSAAEAVLVDFSTAMMEKGRAALTRLDGRYRYVEWDMNSGAWPGTVGGPFDAVVSSAAIHHLDNERKHWLAQAVFDHLVAGGVYANYDLFRDPQATFGPDEVHGRTCASLEEATGFLEAAGYTDLLVTARLPRAKHKGELALLAARRP